MNPVGPLVPQTNIHPEFNTQATGSNGVWIRWLRKKKDRLRSFFTECVCLRSIPWNKFWEHTLLKRGEINSPSFFDQWFTSFYKKKQWMVTLYFSYSDQNILKKKRFVCSDIRPNICYGAWQSDDLFVNISGVKQLKQVRIFIWLQTDSSVRCSLF